MDFGNAIFALRIGIPYLAMLIDLISGAHAALIADLTGSSTWSLFCDVGLDTNSRTCSGISSVADMCLIIWSVMFLMFF